MSGNINRGETASAVAAAIEKTEIKKELTMPLKLYFTHLQSFAVDLTNCDLMEAAVARRDALTHRSIQILFDVGNDAAIAVDANALTMDFLIQ